MPGNRLVVVAGPDAGREFDVDKGGVLGRETQAAIALRDTEVSRRHAWLTVGETGFELEDLDSTNGTFVNDEVLSGSRTLRNGDVVRVGGDVLRFDAAPDPGAAAPAPPRPTIIGPRPVLAPAQQVPPVFAPLPLVGKPERGGLSASRAAVKGQRLATLLVVCIGTFMLLLDTTVVNVALPDIQKDLDNSFTDLQWIVNAYSLALAVFLLTSGSLADLLGRRRIFVSGLVLFTIASVACGLSPTPVALNVARGIQGIGAAAMFATSLALLANAFRGPGRNFAFAAWGATTGAAVALGPLIGGVLTDTFGWQSIFFVNVPLALVAFVLALARVDESRNPAAGGVDWAGLLTFSSSMFLLILALIEGNDRGWGSTRIVGELVASLVLLMLFLVVERRQSHPMLDLALFRNRSFDGASIVAFAMSATIFAMFLYLTLYLQTVLNYTPLQTGLRFLPITALSFVLAPVAGGLSGKVPVRVFLGFGMALVGGGLLLMHGLDPSSGYSELVAGLIVAGCGIGLINPPLATAAVGVVRPERSGMASGANTTFREIGMATGIAGLGAVFQQRVQENVLHAIAGTPIGAGDRGVELAHRVASGDAQAALESVPPSSRRLLGTAFRVGFDAGLNQILLIAGVVALVAAVLGFVLVRQKDFVSSVEGDEEAVPEPAPADAGSLLTGWQSRT